MPLSSGLDGQRVLVTAASTGIGYGAATAFLKEGARVVINSSNREKLDAALGRLGPLGEVHGVQGDLAVKADLENIVQTTRSLLGGIDTLVWHRQSERLAARLSEEGVPNLLVSIPWATHALEFNPSGPSGQLVTYSVGWFLGAVCR